MPALTSQVTATNQPSTQAVAIDERLRGIPVQAEGGLQSGGGGGVSCSGQGDLLKGRVESVTAQRRSLGLGGAIPVD